MDEIKLKRLAIKSTAFMFVVIILSIGSNNILNIATLADANEQSQEVIASPLHVANMDVREKEASILYSSNGTEYLQDPEEILEDKYIMIRKPSRKEISLSLEDLYMERSIKLILKGLDGEKMGYESIIRKNNLITYNNKPILHNEEDNFIYYETDDFAKNISITYDHEVELDEYSATIVIELDTVYVHTIYQNDDYFYINLEKPRDVYDKIVVIDAGHGGNDVGTFPQGMEYVEKDMNLSIVLYLKQLLDKEDIKVYYTRLNDVKPYLRPRVRLANDLEADIFISVHCNGSELSQPHGTEALYNENLGKKNNGSKRLAQYCLDEVTKATGTRNRGLVKGSGKYIIGHADVPVALLEVAYMTNSQDLEFLKNSDNRKLVATGIHDGIMKYLQETSE